VLRETKKTFPKEETILKGENTKFCVGLKKIACFRKKISENCLRDSKSDTAKTWL
jgi:hypothetical protein